MSNLFFYLKQFILKLKSYLPSNNILDWLNGIAFFICIWFFILPYPSFTGLFCFIAPIPIIGVLLTILKKIIDFSSSSKNKSHDNEAEQNIVPLYIILPSIVLALRIYLKFDCENYFILLTHLEIAFLIFGITFLLAYLPSKGSLKQYTQFYGLLGACILFYSYGITFGINCLFDKSLPERFETKIISTFTKGGGEYPRSFHVTVAPWEHHPYKEDLAISENEYKIADTGDYMYISVQKGLLDIPWFYIAHRKYRSAQ